MSFDIKTLSISATAVMPVRDAAGELQYDEQGNPLSITVYGPGSKQFQQAKHRVEDRTSVRAMNRFQGKSEKVSAEEKLAERAQFLADCTVSFNNFGFGDLTGNELFRTVYANIEIGHIADDVEKFIGERANFRKPSATL